MDEPIPDANPLLQQSQILKLSSSSPIGNYADQKFTSGSNSILKSSLAKDPTRSPTMFSTVGNRSIATYNLVVTKGQISPDNFLLPAYLINGQSPGPEIRVKQCSILIVHVTNKLSTPITFHFHGIHQRKSFLADGVPGVTQKPIPPGGSYTYEVDTWPQVGTFFYHAHTGMDIVWLFGPLIIDDDPNYSVLPKEYHWDEDRVFILNGVYHEPLNELVNRIVGPIHDYPTYIASITINGKSFGIWDNETVTQANKPISAAAGYGITTVKKGLRYRFRFINAASDSLLSCNISNHVFTIIETDGIYINPVNTNHLVISPGQRYSLLITMDQVDDNYFISCKHMESAGPRNGLAILNYIDGPKPSDDMRFLNQEGKDTLLMDRWVVDQFSPNYSLNQTDVYKVPEDCDKEFVIDVFEAVVGQRHVYLMNGHYFEDPVVPYFMQVKNGLNISNPPQVFEVIEGEVVQFVFQNQRTGDFCFSHPWHIHGHSFYVVGEGPDRYDPVKDGQRIQENIKNGKRFQFRDSVTVYANQTIGEETDGAFCGWAAVRFAAHNPGK